MAETSERAAAAVTMAAAAAALPTGAAAAAAALGRRRTARAVAGRMASSSRPMKEKLPPALVPASVACVAALESVSVLGVKMGGGRARKLGTRRKDGTG